MAISPRVASRWVALTITLAATLAVPVSSVREPNAAASTANPYCGLTTTIPHYRHVIVIVEENRSYGSVIGSSYAPFTNSLVSRCSLATNYHNVTHYSLPNYLAMTSGMSLAQLAPYYGDCSPTGCSRAVTSASVFAQSMTKGGWRSYEESMPAKCDLYGSGLYAPRHNPAVYYSAVRTQCATRDVALGALATSQLVRDFAHEWSAPGFSFVTPNLCNDGHDCSVSTSDTWLRGLMTALAGTAVYKAKDTAVIVTWDEGEPSIGGEDCARNNVDPSCHVPAIVVAPSVRPGTKSAVSFSHYSLLATAEDLLGLARLGQAKGTTSMVSAFHL